MTVNFTSVGRDHKNWSEELPGLSDRVLLASIRRNSALMSRNVEFAWDESGENAVIIVGGLRCVGKLSVSGGRRIF